MAQWQCHDHFLECRHPWALESKSSAQKTLAGHIGFVVVHSLGMCRPLGPLGSQVGNFVLQRGCTVSFLGLLVLWFESVLLGLDGQLSSHCLVRGATHRG